MIIFQEILTAVPGLNRRKFNRQSLFEQTLNKDKVDLPIVLLEVRSNFLEKLVESLQTEVDQQDERMVQNAVFVYFEDVLKEKSEIMIVEDNKFVD